MPWSVEKEVGKWIHCRDVVPGKHFTALNPYVAGHAGCKTLKLRRQMNYVRHVRKITRKNCNDEKWNLLYEDEDEDENEVAPLSAGW